MGGASIATTPQPPHPPLVEMVAHAVEPIDSSADDRVSGLEAADAALEAERSCAHVVRTLTASLEDSAEPTLPRHSPNQRLLETARRRQPRQACARVARGVLTAACLSVCLVWAFLGVFVTTGSILTFFRTGRVLELDYPPSMQYELLLGDCEDTPITRLVRTNLVHMRAELLAVRGANPLRDSTTHALWRSRYGCLRGVNLGSWLLLERWLVPPDQPIAAASGTLDSPFTGKPFASAVDEYTLSSRLRERGQLDRLTRFRDAFVTRADFERMARLGLNAVRIPFGYWLIAERAGEPYFRGRGLQHLDEAIGWAEDFNIAVLLDLHGAPGGQNGEQTCGRANSEWHHEMFDEDAAVEAVRTLAQRYAGRRGVNALELLNEPTLPTEVAVRYYKRAIEAVRLAGMRAEDVAIVINLYPLGSLQEPESVWRSLLAPHGMFSENIIFDLHLYVSFMPPMLDQLPLCFVLGELVDRQAELLGLLGVPTVAGEWSLRVPWRGPLADDFSRRSSSQQDALLSAFGQRQVAAISWHNASHGVGGYFWSWHAPSSEEQWGYQNVISRGWLDKEAWPGSCGLRHSLSLSQAIS